MAVMMKTPTRMMSLQDQWSSLFTDFTTFTGSCNFIKKVMAVSLSAITFIRGIFPDRAYGERSLGGLKLKILTENTDIEGVNKFINLIRSCYEAVDKKYLQQINIGICLNSENQDEVVESYTMNFRYSDDECSIANNSQPLQLTEDDPTVGATFWLLKSILDINEILTPLPKNAYLTMKLLYNDEITPKDYEPPGFRPAENEKYSFPPNAVKLKIGDVSTDFHVYKMYVKTALSKEPLHQLLEQTVLTDSQNSRQNIQDEPCDADDFVLPSELGLRKEDSQSSQSKAIKTPPEKIQCPCTCDQESGTDILQCCICLGRHHSVCYGFLELDGSEPNFYCVNCVTEDPLKSTKRDFIYLYEGQEQQVLCAVRRALKFCASLKCVTALQLEKGLKCSKQLAKDIIQQLEFEGFIRKSGQKYIVNENKIKNNGYELYFPRPENKENIENLQKSKLPKGRRFSRIGDAEAATRETHNRNLKLKGQTSQEPSVDFDIDNEVEKLSLKGASARKMPLRVSKRKTLKPMVMVEVKDDSEESNPPGKRRCIGTKETIKLEK